jgi:chromosome segregation ATPase
MADVSVEFGAKDTGLEQTLKTIQDQLVSLDGELKTGTLSFEEINKKMREAAQAEKLHSSLGGTKDQIEALGLSFGKSSTEVDKFSQSQKEADIKISAFAEALGEAASGAMSLDSRLAFVQKNLQEFRDKAASAELTAEELEDTLKKIGSLESAERRLKGIGDASSESKPKIEGLANATQDAGQKAEGAGGMFDESFKRIAAAFTIGNLAAQGFQKIVDLAFDAARAVVQGFSDAIDLGGRLDDLSKRTGETAGNLYILEGAFKEAGLSADQVGTTINKLQNFMQDASNGGERQTATMNKLGISLEQLAGKTPTQQMEIFAQKIAGIQDPTQRAATASEVFGEKLGGKLLPLLLEFPQTLDNVRDRTGGMADVMDESAATFARAGDTIDAVEGKLVQFAAGILSEVIPPLSDLGTSMEEVDAAGLGKDVGEALAPMLVDLADATRGAIDVLAELAKKTQAAAQETKNLANDVGITDQSLAVLGAAAIVAADGMFPLVKTFRDLRQRGEDLRNAANEAKTSIEGVGTASAEVAPALDEASGSTERFATSLQDIGTDSGQAFTDINNGATTFKSLIDEGNISLSDMSGQIGGQIPLQTEQIALVGELNTSLGEANEKAGEQLAKIEQQVAAEQARNEKIAERQEKSAADYNLQIQINEALAAGNTELAEGLENQRELSQLTEKIMRETGMAAKAAGQLAEQLIFTKDAADKAAKSAEPLSKNVNSAATAATIASDELKTVRDVIEAANKEEMDNPAKTLKERTEEAQDKLSEMKDFIGEDMSKMNLSDIIDKLGLDVPGLTNTEEQLGYIEDAIKDLEEADPADITPKVDEVGVHDKINVVKEYLKELNDEEKTDVTPKIDQEKLEEDINTAKETFDDLLTKEPVKVDLNAEESVEKIRKDLKEEIDLALQSSKGTEHLSSIDKLVGKIEELVSKISEKLPMQALSY